MRRSDGAPSVESEDETNAITSGRDSGERKSRVIRSDESQARRKAMYKQRQRARKASTNGSQIMIDLDVAQEAKEAE